MGELKNKVLQSRLKKVIVPIEFTCNEVASIMTVCHIIRETNKVYEKEHTDDKKAMHSVKTINKDLDTIENKLIHAILDALHAPHDLENWDKLKNFTDNETEEEE